LKIQKPREIAFRILLKREQTRRFTENLLDRELTQNPQSPADRGLCQELVYGCIRWQAALDHLIEARTDGRRQSPGVRIALRLGLYQLFWLDRVPQHAAVHETVAVAKALGSAGQSGFINAVLRHYTREHTATREHLAHLKVVEPAVGYSHPDWLVKHWSAQFGEETTCEFLDWNNRPAKTFARVNTLKTTAAELTDRWQAEENVTFEPVEKDWLKDTPFFELKSYPPLASLPSFQDGGFYIQDPGTALACRMVDPQPGEEILDYCAAPGGKTTLLAQLAGDQANITAHDVSEKRLRMVRENCERLGIRSVAEFVTAADAEEILADRKYDKILLDAPCSNTGVLRRRIDLRWRITEDEITRLAQGQRSLLTQASRYLKPGGRLVYSTCSVEAEENTADLKFSESRQLTPFADGVDGAFAAVIK
jgi:16S rRNA (cytosine967-C5)-methyltransferase